MAKLHTTPEIDVVVLTHSRSRMALYCHPKGAINISEFPNRRALAALEMVEGPNGPLWFALTLAAAVPEVVPPLWGVATAPSELASSTTTASGNRGGKAQTQLFNRICCSSSKKGQMQQQSPTESPRSVQQPSSVVLQARCIAAIVVLTLRNQCRPSAGQRVASMSCATQTSCWGMFFGTLVGQGLHRLLWKSACRFVFTVFLSLLIAAVSIALMIELTKTDDLAFCCAEDGAVNKAFTCWDHNSTSFLNATAAGDVESRYIDRLCLEDGDIFRNARTGFLFGALFSIGRLLILTVCGAFLSLLWACFTHFQTVRVTALQDARVCCSISGFAHLGGTCSRCGHRLGDNAC